MINAGVNFGVTPDSICANANAYVQYRILTPKN